MKDAMFFRCMTTNPAIPNLTIESGYVRLFIDTLISTPPIVVYELLAPNKDGSNETFYIENLNPNEANEAIIFNLSHQVVYHSFNYANDWDGSTLPVGTYYYHVKTGVPENLYKGVLYLKR